jgi:hypothetical protein
MKQTLFFPLLLLLCPVIVVASEKTSSPLVKKNPAQDIKLTNRQVADYTSTVAENIFNVCSDMQKASNVTIEKVTHIEEDVIESLTLAKSTAENVTNVYNQNNELAKAMKLVVMEMNTNCNLIKDALNAKRAVVHTVVVPSDIQVLKAENKFQELETLGGDAVHQKDMSRLKVTPRDIHLDGQQAKAGWSLLGATTKESRAEVLAQKPTQTIPENQMFQARSDVNYMIGELSHTLKNRTAPIEIQALLAELKKEQMPHVEKIGKLFEVGITNDKEVEKPTHKQLEEQRKRIFTLVDLTMNTAAEWLGQIQQINNYLYEKTKGDQDVVGAADTLNYKNQHLLTALVLQHKKELAEQSKALENNNNNNESSDIK